VLIWTPVTAVTELVFTVKEPAVAPALTVTDGGTVATAELALVRATTAPPLGAGALSATVPVEVFPPTRVAGVRVKEDKVAGAATGALPV
jgi:hypothetical protein